MLPRPTISSNVQEGTSPTPSVRSTLSYSSTAKASPATSRALPESRATCSRPLSSAQSTTSTLFQALQGDAKTGSDNDSIEYTKQWNMRHGVTESLGTGSILIGDGSIDTRPGTAGSGNSVSRAYKELYEVLGIDPPITNNTTTVASRPVTRGHDSPGRPPSNAETSTSRRSISTGRNHSSSRHSTRGSPAFSERSNAPDYYAADRGEFMSPGARVWARLVKGEVAPVEYRPRKAASKQSQDQGK